MALPKDVKRDAVARVTTYCATRVPSELDDQIRIEYELRGKKITIYECRPPWREDLGPEWTRLRVCTMEWDPATRRWTLFARDRNDRRLEYPHINPTPTVKPLLAEVDRDPTGIFWG